MNERIVELPGAREARLSDPAGDDVAVFRRTRIGQHCRILSYPGYSLLYTRAVPSRLWARWKRVAHRAAVIQSHVLLALLYWMVVTPIGAIRRGSHPSVIAPPSWTPRETKGAVTLEDARRQF